MNIKKLLLISITALVIISSLSVTSAGLFDFLGSDSDSDNPISVEMGNITYSEANSLMIVEDGFVVGDDGTVNASSEDAGYNLSCSVQIDISNLNDSSRQLLEEGINNENDTTAEVSITFNNSENSTEMLFTDIDTDYKIDGDTLYIDISREIYSHQEVFSGDITVSSLVIKMLGDRGEEGVPFAYFYPAN